MKRLASLIALIFTTLSATADLSRTVQIEQTLETRTLRMIQSVDPDASVSVKVVMKESKVQLPGVNVDYYGSMSVEKIFAEDVDAIKIKISSTLDPFPEWLQKDLQADLTFGKIKVEFDIKSYSPEVLTAIHKQSPTSKVLDQLIATSGRLWPVTLALVAIVFALFMTGSAILSLWFMSFWRGQLVRMTQAVESSAGASASFAPNDSDKKAQPEHVLSATGELDIMTNGLTELLADCYWSKTDSYARWLWDQARSKEREAVISAWPLMSDYAQFLQSQAPVARADHNHPYYLKPLVLRGTDQKDLSQLVLKKSELWHHLPPLRRESLEIPLKQRITLMSAPLKDLSTTEYEKIKSKPRELEQAQAIGRLTSEDELQIWENPNLVPSALREAVPSLIWVALLDIESRKDVLSRLSAADLAQIWLGPDEVLKLLRDAIPEKKMRLVDGYIQSRSPNRESTLFAKIAAEGARQLNQQDTQGNGKKAA